MNRKHAKRTPFQLLERRDLMTADVLLAGVSAEAVTASIGDFNEDGFDDVLGFEEGGTSLNILLGSGQGEFGLDVEPGQVDFGISEAYLTSAATGRVVEVVVQSQDETLTVIQQITIGENGLFEVSEVDDQTTGVGSRFDMLLDWNGDGISDTLDGNEITLGVPRGDLGFLRTELAGVGVSDTLTERAIPTLNVGNAGDLNGDGLSDIFINQRADDGSYVLDVIYGSADAAEGGPRIVDTADILPVSAAEVLIINDQGFGTIASPDDLPSNIVPVGDSDGDGKTELQIRYVNEGGSYGIQTITGDAVGTFEDFPVAPGGPPIPVAANLPFDFNGDGFEDAFDGLWITFGEEATEPVDPGTNPGPVEPTDAEVSFTVSQNGIFLFAPEPIAVAGVDLKSDDGGFEFTGSPEFAIIFEAIPTSFVAVAPLGQTLTIQGHVDLGLSLAEGASEAALSGSYGDSGFFMVPLERLELVATPVTATFGSGNGTDLVHAANSDVVLNFSEPLTLNQDDEVVVSLVSGDTVNELDAVVAADGLSATISLDGIAAGAYTFSMESNLATADGRMLDGNNDGIHGGSIIQPLKVAPPGDVNLDGAVNFADFLIVSQNFGSTDAVFAEGDLNGDGTVSFADFLLVSQNFGEEI